MSKKNIILGGVLVVLILGAWFYSGPISAWQKKADQAENFLSGLAVADIDKIEISNSGQATTLERQGERFKIAGTKDFYTDDTTAQTIIQMLIDAEKASFEVVSKNKDKKSDFQTDDSFGTKIKLFRGEKVLADFVIGKMTSDYMGSYISQDEIDETFSIDVNLSTVFARSDWRDDKIFVSDKNAINKIRFQYPNREFTVEKIGEGEELKWAGTLPYKFEVSEEKIAKVLEIMSNLRAVQIPEQDFTVTDLDKNLIIVQATGENIDNTLMVGKDNGAEFYYVKQGNSDNIYLITKEQRDELEKQIWELK